MIKVERYTEYDEVRGCYGLKPDVYQGKHIQRLGKCEDIVCKLIELEYIHNFQNERSDIRDFCYLVSEIQKQAKQLEEEEVNVR